MQNTLAPATPQKPEQLPADVQKQIQDACMHAPKGTARNNCIADVTYLFERQAQRFEAASAAKTTKQRER